MLRCRCYVATLHTCCSLLVPVDRLCPLRSSGAASDKPGSGQAQDVRVKRKDRLAALEDDLRSAAPDPRTAPSLAERFGVSVRTIERDLVELQRSGVPIWARPGPLGGYTVDDGDALPEIALTLAEAAA